MRSQKNYPEQLNLSEFPDKSLLILDDDDPLRGRLTRAMEKKGFSVKEAKTVAEGLQMVKNNPPSFALVDLRLEDGNGLDVVKELYQGDSDSDQDISLHGLFNHIPEENQDNLEKIKKEEEEKEKKKAQNQKLEAWNPK